MAYRWRLAGRMTILHWFHWYGRAMGRIHCCMWTKSCSTFCCGWIHLLKKSGLPYPITRIFDYFGLDTFTYTHGHTHVRQFIPCLTKLQQTKSKDSPNCRQTWHGSALVPRPRPKSAGERPWRPIMLDRSQGFSLSETRVIFLTPNFRDFFTWKIGGYVHVEELQPNLVYNLGGFSDHK